MLETLTHPKWQWWKSFIAFYAIELCTHRRKNCSYFRILILKKKREILVRHFITVDMIRFFAAGQCSCTYDIANNAWLFHLFYGIIYNYIIIYIEGGGQDGRHWRQYQNVYMLYFAIYELHTYMYIKTKLKNFKTQQIAERLFSISYFHN